MSLLLLSSLLLAARAVTLTGDAAKDFAGVSESVVAVVDGTGPDVGVPRQLGDRISGWDINRIFVFWDKAADSLTFGIDCFGVCGDADADGDEGRTSPELASLGGEDLKDLSRGEGIVIALDFDFDAAPALAASFGQRGAFDFILGVPAGQPADAVENAGAGQISTLECSRGQTGDALLSAAQCIGLYEYQNSNAVAIARRFLRRAELNGAPWPFVNHNPTPTAAKPDYEWTIGSLAALRARANSPVVADGSWGFDLQAFAGSFLDAGIGEDYIPSQDKVSEVRFPCSVRDACDVCGGNGSTCRDCAGVANGPARYDDCDVCGGNSATCADCQGMPNGRAVYDLCDVCNGDSSTCVDCRGVAGGSSKYDACDLCGGDGSACQDCNGKANGSSVYDECDVCDGDGTSCCGAGGKECCKNYCDVPDAYWDFILLPVTIDDIIDKLRFANEIFAWLCEALPPYEQIGPKSRDLYFGRMAEFNRVFLEECLEDFCEASGTLYEKLAAEELAC